MLPFLVCLDDIVKESKSDLPSQLDHCQNIQAFQQHYANLVLAAHLQNPYFAQYLGFGDSRFGYHHQDKLVTNLFHNSSNIVGGSSKNLFDHSNSHNEKRRSSVNEDFGGPRSNDQNETNLSSNAASSTILV